MIVLDSAIMLKDLLCKICPKSNPNWDAFIPSSSELYSLYEFKKLGLATTVIESVERVEVKIWVTTTKGTEMVLGWMCDE